MTRPRCGAIVVLTLWGGPLVGCGTTPPVGTGPGSTPRSSVAIPASVGLVPADPRLVDRIELTAYRVPAGQPLSGYLVVSSTAPAPIDLTRMCRPDFAVVLSNGTITNWVGFAAVCSLAPFVVIPGVNRFPVQVITSYSGCSPPTQKPTRRYPNCVRGTVPALPPGDYHALLQGSGALALPAPSPVAVTLTRSH